MQEEKLILFSASGFSTLDVGQYVPDLSKVFPDYFASDYQPKVTKKYEVIARGISLYKGDKFVHNLNESDLEKTANGAVLELSGSEDSMKWWMDELDKFEESYGMNKEEWKFKIIGTDRSIYATIYVLENLAKIGDKDGKLTHLDGTQ